jgi:integrase
LFTWLSFGSAQPSKVAQFSVGANKHLVKLSDLAAKRRNGDWSYRTDLIPQEKLSVESAPQGGKATGRKLRELFDAYAQDKTLNDGDNRATRRTLKAYRVVVEGFIELQGDLDLAEVGRETVAAYRAALAKLPAKGEGIRGLSASKLIAKAEAEGLPRLSEPTIRNKIRTMSAVLSQGVRLGWLRENPIIAGGVGRAAAKAATKRQSGARRRKDYNRDELRAIFSSPIYTKEGWTPPRANFGRAWYWLPLLMYYTGARREELAQLAASEVRRSEEGIWHLSILEVQGDDDTERGVKTTGSRRSIPLHDDLIERGFVTYVEGVPTGGQLFPALTANPVGYFGANFGKRWATYLRDVVKLGSTASPSHGFRHAFKTLCREVGIPEDVHDAMTGHTGAAGAARAYGSMPLSAMARELRKFPAAPLPQLEL